MILPIMVNGSMNYQNRGGIAQINQGYNNDKITTNEEFIVKINDPFDQGSIQRLFTITGVKLNLPNYEVCFEQKQELKSKANATTFSSTITINNINHELNLTDTYCQTINSEKGSFEIKSTYDLNNENNIIITENELYYKPDIFIDINWSNFFTNAIVLILAWWGSWLIVINIFKELKIN
ncbi:hypothetical protein JXA48_01680 [Candidatus Woesearchaeota archaeon]|nr:hypothetical protein [Candidatus Woesearchaeota archaeon]